MHLLSNQGISFFKKRKSLTLPIMHLIFLKRHLTNFLLSLPPILRYNHSKVYRAFIESKEIRKGGDPDDQLIRWN
jgi:hypothetical protein